MRARRSPGKKVDAHPRLDIVNGMSKLRRTAVALALLAILAQPVLAQWLPCTCAAHSGDAARSCCMKLPAALPSAEFGAEQAFAANAGGCPMCARHGSQSPAPVQRHCCCLQTVTWTAATPSVERTDVGSGQPLLAVEVPSTAANPGMVEVAAATRLPERFRCASGPPLLALHCVWLK